MKDIEELRTELFNLRAKNIALYNQYGSGLKEEEQIEKEIQYLIRQEELEKEIKAQDSVSFGMECLKEEEFNEKSPFDTFENYLIMVGIRSSEYTYTDEELFASIDFFKECYDRHMGAYYALLFLNDRLIEK